MERPEALRGELALARRQTDGLFRLISPEALYSRPISQRHRLIFYLGHFEAFDWNLLASRSLGASRFHPEFDSLFERGIDPPPGQTPQDEPSDWPQQSEVEIYNLRTRKWIDEHLNDMDPCVVHMAIEHRLMHAETFAYLMHNLPYADKSGGERPKESHQPAPRNPMVRIAAGTATLGKSHESFGWDNEYAAHNVPVDEFGVLKHKVSNGEYLEFVREGGAVPHFWSNENGRWFYRGMFGTIPLPLDYPVWVTWEQAEAFAKWRGLTLPSEAQFHRAAASATFDPHRDNFGFHRWDPVAVNAAIGDCAGPAQLVGNGWEWTRDVFAPFQGFRVDPNYPGYSADFFDARHYVLKGASPRTAEALTRPSFRNWFRPDYPYVYAGFRLVEN